MPNTAFDSHDLDDMVHEAERWVEPARVHFLPLAERMATASRDQQREMLNMGLGNTHA